MQEHIDIAAIDLFCGIGGLTNGLKQAGIDVKAGIDFDNNCKYAYEINNDAKFIGKDITKITGDDLKKLWGKNKIKFLVGCAPCQPFSTHSNKVNNKENGDKWNLLNEYLRLIEETKPLVLSMENVTNLANKDIFVNFVSKLKKLGYFVSYKNVFCPDYGIPQKRRRLVLLASKLGEISLLPPTHNKQTYITVKDAIGNLPVVNSGERDKKDLLHFTSKLSDLNLKRIKASVPNGTWEDWNDELKLNCHKKQTGKTYRAVYGRMSWKEPSPTITTQFYNYGTGRFGHPEQNRALTVREASILQTFPKDYKFVESEDSIFMTRLGTHIGNAVPVKLGYIIGRSILNHLNIHKNERI
ncbi:MAG: DNA (cytosine-5-)-methyltransferase [Bacteroidales bacterium]